MMIFWIYPSPLKKETTIKQSNIFSNGVKTNLDCLLFQGGGSTQIIFYLHVFLISDQFLRKADASVSNLVSIIFCIARQLEAFEQHIKPVSLCTVTTSRGLMCSKLAGMVPSLKLTYCSPWKYAIPQGT